MVALSAVRGRSAGDGAIFFAGNDDMFWVEVGFATFFARFTTIGLTQILSSVTTKPCSAV
jgi:hypothetical protein